IALAVPQLLSLHSSAPVPAVVVEIAAGIGVGPAVLGWVPIDPAIEVVALVGLTFVLFLAGLELDLGPLRGRVLTVVGLGLVVPCVLETPTLVAVVLCTTALGVPVPVVKDAG